MSTKIEWCQETWNPITGCSPISEGCANCYARHMAYRLRGRYGYPQDEPFKVTVHYDRLANPGIMKWGGKERHIFVCSMSDLFHENVRYHIQDRILDICRWFDIHTFLFLTKRPQRMKEVFERWHNDHPQFHDRAPFDYWWLGVTAENQQRADERIPILLQIPAAKRFVSLEPMLGAVDISKWDECDQCGAKRKDFDLYNEIQEEWNAWRCYRHFDPNGACDGVFRSPLDWVILGGETGPHARPMHPDWVRSVRDQCQSAGVPFFFKSWGEHTPVGQLKTPIPQNKLKGWNWGNDYIIYRKQKSRLLDGQEWNEVPE